MKKSLTLTLMMGVLAVEVCMLSLLVWNSVRLIHSSHAEIFERTVQEEAWLLSNSLVNGLTVRDRAILNDNLQALKENKNFVYAAVYDRRNNLMADIGVVPYKPDIDKSYNDALSDGVYDINRVINVYGNPLGTLYAGFSIDEIKQLSDETKSQNTKIAIGEIILSIIVTLLTALYLVGRIKQLEDGAIALAKGDYQYRIPEKDDELGRLAKSFNTLSANLEQTIVSLKEERAELVSTAEYAQRASKAKSQFMSNMSHELRTPLNAIIGYSDISKDDIEDRLGKEDAKDIVAGLDAIYKSGVHLLSLVEDVLDFSEMVKDNIVLDRSTCSIKAIIHNASSEVSEELAKNNDIITVYLDPDRDSIYTDVDRLQQVLTNILRNAANYTKEGEVTIRVRNEPDYFRIIISDTGIGIEQSNIEQIFDAFYQVDGSNTRAVDGTGLGLTIVRNLCHLLGAELKVSSTPGLGSTFSLIFPQAELAEPAKVI